MAEATQLGGAARWFERQLQPAAIPDPEADELLSWWPNLTWAPSRKWADGIGGGLPVAKQETDFARWTLVHRMITKHQLLDVMVDFWSNLLFVPIPIKEAFAYRLGYDNAIRANALGTYEQLLKAAVLHPAMLCYLDNANSTRRAPNENLGRELLELHTVGHDAGFDEGDVLDSTRILTGYRVTDDGTCRRYYSPADHYTGSVNVLSFGARNSMTDGRPVVDDYLTYLAHHPATAHRVARRLAIRFVADQPPRDLVEGLASVFRESGTDIKTTLRALVAHPAFQQAGPKIRTPCEDFVNTYRVLQVKIHPPTGDPGEAATTLLYLCGAMGQQPLRWPRPDGFPDVADAWSSASRMLGSWRIHRATAAGIMPRRGIDFKTPHDWVPDRPIRFDRLVERLCRLLLAKPADERLLQTACKAVGFEPDEMVTRHSGLLRFRFSFLLMALLDTPDHMSR